MKERGRGIAVFVVSMVLAGPFQAFSQPRLGVNRSNIIGQVVDAQGAPIKNAEVAVQDPDDKEVVARGITNDQGEYVIECLKRREYHLTLGSLPERFLGQTAVVNLGIRGLIVQWSASTDAPAVATARSGGGVCGAAAAFLAAGAVVGGGVTVGILVSEDSDDPRGPQPPASPSR
jgi:carboxypeptidase family protein